MKTTKRIIVMTKKGQIIPLNVKWIDRFSTPVNVARYVLPMVGCDCVVAISRGYVWTGKSDWHGKFEKSEMWQGAINAQMSDNTLWS